MRAQPERILLFRSGRHLGVALDTLRHGAPACDVTVVATPAAAAALDAAGIDASHRILYDATPFFQPWAFVGSAAWRQAVGGRFERVVVLWNDPDGSGQTNVDSTALTVSPSGFTAITPDGRLVVRRTWANLGRIAARAALSVAVTATLALALWVPARLGALGRRAAGRPASP